MNGRELEGAIQEMLDGTLDGERTRALDQTLLESPEARRIYLSYARLHGALGVTTGGRRTVESWGIVPVDHIVSLQRQRWVKLSLAAAVMLSLFTGALLWWRMAPESEPRHAYQAMPGAEFSVIHPDDGMDETGNFLRTGSRLKLRSGKFECWIHEGVHAVVEGPADLTVRGEKEIFLAKGNAWFNVAKGAEGFTVITPEAEIVDLGTEFGVVSDPGADDEAHVFTGKVRIRNLRKSSESRILKAGESSSFDEGGNYGKAPADRSKIFAALAEESNMRQPANLKHRVAGRPVFAAPPSRVSREAFTAATANFQADDWLQTHRSGIRFTTSRDFLFGNPGLLTNGSDTRGAIKGAAPAPEGVDNTTWDFVVGPGAGEGGFTLTGITVHGVLAEEIDYGHSRGDLQFGIRYSTVAAPEVFRPLLPNDTYMNPGFQEGGGIRVSVAMQFPLREIHTLRFVIAGSPSREGSSSSYAEIDVNGFPTEP